MRLVVLGLGVGGGGEGDGAPRGGLESVVSPVGITRWQPSACLDPTLAFPLDSCGKRDSLESVVSSAGVVCLSGPHIHIVLYHIDERLYFSLSGRSP